MARIRILVVDDSTVIRMLLCEILAQDPELEVLASACDGQIALAKIQQLKPDLVTLDIEMPVMDGLATLKELRKTDTKLPVIMFSALTERGASATLDALSLGASDYVTKPSNMGSQDAATAAIQAELIPKIKALCRSSAQHLKTLPPPKPAIPMRSRSKQPVEIVAIGTSTGGPRALAEVLPHIPKDFPVPIVVVQHMPPLFTQLLAARLASQSAIKVSEGGAGIPLAPGCAWIAPGNFHMTVARTGLISKLDLNQHPQEHSCRPAVDALFRSVAVAFRGNVLAVVMTGMGSDGVQGARQIREAGGEVIIQDEATSVVWGMPGLVYAAGQADAVYPLNQLAPEITRRVLRSRQRQTDASSNSFASMETRAK